MNNTLLQVISVSPKDSITIQKAGANRIQLVSALQIGGLTPSPAVIRKSLESVDIPVMVMVRHHNNGFQYSNQEIKLLLDEIIELKNFGVKGLVIGGITPQKQIDQNLIKLVNQEISTNKISWTFHKAFDETNILENYQKLCSNMVPRVLTQGGKQNITKNYSILSNIIQKSNQKNNFKTKILLGGGITSQNIQQIRSQTKATEFHVGTCVRKNKYGDVLVEKVQELVIKVNLKN